MENEKQIDILAIGDIATDVFIKIKDAEEKCDADGSHCKLCINYGGKIPYESALVCHAVGNSANVAVSASRLGLNVFLVSYVGNDVTGVEDIEQLTKEKVRIDYVNTILNKESNYHYVLWYGTERTILVKHTEFPYSFKNLNLTTKPKWIYLSSLASNSVDYHNEISEYIVNNPDVSLAFQPGTFQIKLGVSTLSDIYKNSKLFICNHEEAKKILNEEGKEIPELLKMIYALGPKIVVITDDVKGAFSYDGAEILFMKAITTGPFVESTGAGDAFSGALVSALSHHRDMKTALKWAALNAMSVIAYVGPHEGLLTNEQIEDRVKNLSSDYEPINIQS